MGGFYGVVYLRTEDREPVRDLLETMARKKRTNFLLGPVIRGWLGVYPQNGGQDQRVSRTIAKHVPCDVLHVLVHDDDIFCYYLYRAGRLIDQYNSCPDYFGGHVSERKRRKMRGNPSHLAHLLPDPASLPQLEELLATPQDEQPVFAVETLQRFAELLGLPNALASYEYLDQGETDDIEGWDEFLHIPAAEIARREAVHAGVDAEKQRLQQEGLLLLAQPGTGKNVYVQSPQVCPAAEGDAFWVCWANGITQGEAPLERYAPPWSSPPQRVGIELASTVYALGTSRGRRLLAVGYASGNWKAQLWDVAQRRLLVEHDHTSAVRWANVTADETSFVSRSGNEAIRSTIRDPDSRRSYPVPGGGQFAALHPSGDFLVVDMQVNLGLLDLRSGRLYSPLCLGQRQDPTRLHHAMARQARAQMVAMDYEAVAQQMEKMLKKAGLDTEEIREAVTKQIDDMKEQMAQVGTPAWLERQAPVRGTERPFVMEFDPAGMLLFCATSAGCRVYEWGTVLETALAGGEQMPRPARAASPGPVTRTSQAGVIHTEAYVYTLAFDARADRLLFGGLSGTIDYLDLRLGLSGTLLELPGRPVVQQLALNGDGTALACHVQPDFYEQGKRRRPPELHVWNYRALSDKLPGRDLNVVG